MELKDFENLPRIDWENSQIACKHLNNFELARSYFIFKLMTYPNLVKIGTRLIKWALKLHIPVELLLKHGLFFHFCGGESIGECQVLQRKLNKLHVGCVLDYAVEGKTLEAEFDSNLKEILATICAANSTAKQQEHAFAVFKLSGVARFELLEKVSERLPLNSQEEKEWHKVHQRVSLLAKTAYNEGVKLLIDAEESWIQKAIDNLAEEMQEIYNRDGPVIFNTVQMYRRDRYQYLVDQVQKAERDSLYLGIKLVRGAYMERERERAKKKGYPSPIHANKAETDIAFDKALKLYKEHSVYFSIFAGTHNQKSTQLLVEILDSLRRENGGKDLQTAYFSQLLGMSDNLTFPLAERGFAVFKYVPFGPVKEAIPYLIRRAEENSSIDAHIEVTLKYIKRELKRRMLAKNI